MRTKMHRFWKHYRGNLTRLLLIIAILLIIVTSYANNSETGLSRHWCHMGNGLVVRTNRNGGAVKQYQWTAEKLTVHLRQGSEFHLLEYNERIETLDGRKFRILDDNNREVATLKWDCFQIQRIEANGTEGPILRMGEFEHNLVYVYEDQG